mmetsp:Transcript_54041/g.121400  ORF Transcript_54041/g.121400 Transcript_54041/m.121400 type:complete len:234 (-) Transcript_54041:23-724(-)
MVDYSRFDHIDVSDSDEDQGHESLPEAEPRGPPAETRPQAPDVVLDDLHDYFGRVDARRSEQEANANDFADALSVASVECFDAADLAALWTEKGPGPRGEECAICLSLPDRQEEVVVLPCAAAHRFHKTCAHEWLSRNVTCPLCRVDVRTLIRATQTASGSSTDRSSQLTPRSFGRTRDGGIIRRYEPHPPPELQRPWYIEPQHYNIAELVEIEYPERGTARIWRVPNVDAQS